MNAIAHRLTQITMIAATLAAGFTAQASHAAPPVRVVQLPTVVVTAKRIPVVQLERVVIVARRLAPEPAAPVATEVAQRNARSVALPTNGRV